MFMFCFTLTAYANISSDISFSFGNFNYIQELQVKLGYPLLTKNLSLGTSDREVTRLKYVFNLEPNDMTEDYKSTYTIDLSNKIKELQKENSISPTGVIDAKTKDLINNLFFWSEYRESGMKLKNTPEWNRIKKLPVSMVITKTKCSYPNIKLDTGDVNQCSLAFSIKNNSLDPIAIENITIKASKFTDTSKINSFSLMGDIYQDFYFKGTKIKNGVLSLSKPTSKNPTISPGNTESFEFLANTLLEMKGNAQFSLDSISTIFGKIKKLNSYPIGDKVTYVERENLGTLTAAREDYLYENENIVPFENRKIEVNTNDLVAVFKIANLLNSTLTVEKLIFKVTTDTNAPLASYVERFKSASGPVNSSGFYEGVGKQESVDTFSLNANSSLAGGTSGAGFFIFMSPPSSIGKIKLDLIEVKTKEGRSPTNLPIQGIYQTVVNP